MAETPDASTPPPSLWKRFKRFQTRSAIKLDKNRTIYALFGLTALSDARNIISYLFELSTESGDSASDRMHNWLMTPAGIAIATIESLFLIAFAVIGSYFEDNHPNPVVRALAFIWPYVRESIKALKNGYKGGRSLIFFAVTFGASALATSSLILPLGISIGIAYLLNRIWYRSMCGERKKMQNMNDALSTWTTLSTRKRQAELEKNPLLKQALQKCCDQGLMKKITDDVDARILLGLIHRHQTSNKLKAYLSAGLNGALDGLYLYAGLYLLCSLVPVLAIVINTFAIFFVMLSIVRNIYEEYCFQRKLKLSAYKAEKELLESLPKLSEDEAARLEVVKKKFTQTSTFTFLHALGESVRDSLGLYCAITGVIFAITLFTPIPLVVVFCAIGVGVSSLVGFACYNLWKTHEHYSKNEQTSVRENKFPDKTEVIRSTASGAKQGAKQASFVLNGLQEQNEQGHYQSSRVIFIVTCVLAFFLSIIYALKALAKGFGRSKRELTLPYAGSVDDLARSSSDNSLTSPRRPPGNSTDNMLDALGCATIISAGTPLALGDSVNELCTPQPSSPVQPSPLLPTVDNENPSQLTFG